MNGLAAKNDKNELKPYNYSPNKKISWADSNQNRNQLCSTNLGKELMFMKEIKPVTSHKKLKPSKSCMKRSNSSEIRKSNVYTSKLIENVNLSLGSINKENTSNSYSPNIINSKMLSSVNISDSKPNDIMKSYSGYSTNTNEYIQNKNFGSESIKNILPISNSIY